MFYACGFCLENLREEKLAGFSTTRFNARQGLRISSQPLWLSFYTAPIVSQLNEHTTSVVCFYVSNRNSSIFPPLVFNQKFWFVRDLVVCAGNIVERLFYSEFQEGNNEEMLEIEALVSIFNLYFNIQDKEYLLVRMFELLNLQKSYSSVTFHFSFYLLQKPFYNKSSDRSLSLL